MDVPDDEISEDYSVTSLEWSDEENNYKEKIFVSLAWLPKATVQAALGPVALGKAKEALAKYLAETQSSQDCSSEDIMDQGNIYKLYIM